MASHDDATLDHVDESIAYGVKLAEFPTSLEAARASDIRPVRVKSVEQQALQGLHRIRSLWMGTRTSRINALRGFCREFGITIPQGARAGVETIGRVLADPRSAVPDLIRHTAGMLLEEIRLLEARIAQVERELASVARLSPACTLLLSVPGIGLLTATALVAAVILGLFWWQYWSPAQEEYKTKSARLEALRTEIRALEVTANKLQEFQREVALLEAKLETLKRILPPEKETPDLMRKVQSLAAQSNLVIRKFTPGTTAASCSPSGESSVPGRHR